MNSTEIIDYAEIAFDNRKYASLQKDEILKRIDNFKEGRLYLEIGGKFLHDPHAARVLPGFQPDVKKNIFSTLKSISDLFFCVNAKDIVSNRQLKNSPEKYSDAVMRIAQELEEQLNIRPKFVVNLNERSRKGKTSSFEDHVKAQGYEIYKRFVIEGYPNDTDNVLSSNGYGFDDHIETSKKLILVVGAASNSGKMSTCLGQIYNDQIKGIKSGYAKYETFPIWSLPISHPVNLAYEAATADIGDYNVLDTYHELAYGKRSVNYNRDVEAFEIIKMLSDKFLDKENPMTAYRSPTDMGINYAGYAITDDQIVCVASLNEIRRRRNWYKEIVERGEGETEWLRKCDSLETQAMKYIREQSYNPNLPI